jgi:hypothetical protein
VGRSLPLDWSPKTDLIGLLQAFPAMTNIRESLLKLKLYFFHFYKTAELNEEAYCTEPSPSEWIPFKNTSLVLGPKPDGFVSVLQTQ